MPWDASAIRACCVSYARLIPDREKHYSDLAAKALGIPIVHIIADDLALFAQDVAPKTVPPEPVHVALLWWPVSRAVFGLMAEHGRLVLTGQDGDTLMTESPKHYLAHLLGTGNLRGVASAVTRYVLSHGRLPPVGLLTTLKRLVGRYPAKSAYPYWLEPSLEARLGLRQRWRDVNAEPPKAHPTRPLAFQAFSLPTWSRLFEAYDPGLTGFAVEARHPLLDVRVMEYLLRLPPVPWCVNKHIVRVAMRGRLPEEILSRPKSPLAGDPAVALAADGTIRPIDQFEARPELARYVRRDDVPVVSGSRDSETLQMNLRPFALNLWLEAQEAVQ
jgi:asparagine synthase (glutamine-hydrolysing)